MNSKLKLGTAYHGNRILRHVEEDMRDIVNHNMNLVVHMFTHNDMDRHRSVLKDIISISKNEGLEVWVDNWGIDDGPGDKAYITSLIPQAAQEFSNGERCFRPCFNHPDFRDFTKSWVDAVAQAGGDILFWDEPHMLVKDNGVYACHCKICQKLFEEKYNKKMPETLDSDVMQFRTNTLIDYFKFATDYSNSLGMKNTGCIRFEQTQGISLDSIDRIISLPHFDNIGCDPYWCNIFTEPQDIYDYNYSKAKIAVDAANAHGKDHNIWLQSYDFPNGREDEMLIAADALYDAGARTIISWSFRGGESNDYRAESTDKVWNLNGEIMRRLRDRYYNELIDNLRKNRK